MHSWEFWTKLERDFLAQVTQETRTEKVTQKALKSQCPSVRAALVSPFYMKFSLMEKAFSFTQ